MRTITIKAVQVHEWCNCGYNSVYQDTFPIKWKDLSASGIIRKKDKDTGKPFLLWRNFINCDKNCHPYD